MIDCHCVVCHGRLSPWRSIIGVVPQKWLSFSVTMTVFGHNVLFWLVVPQKWLGFSVTIDVEHRRPHLHPAPYRSPPEPYHTAQETGETLTVWQIVSGAFWLKSVNPYVVP